MIKLLSFCLVMLYSSWAQEFEEAVSRMDMLKVADMIRNIESSNYEVASEILVKNREQYALNAYMRIVSDIQANSDFYKYIAQYADREKLDNKLFAMAFYYYMEQGQNAAVNFAIRHSNDDVDYFRWCMVFRDSSILKRIADKSYAYSELHFFSNAIMYVETGKKKYIDDMMRYNDEKIRNFYYYDIVDETSAWNIIDEMIDRGRGQTFVNEIAARAVIDIDNDYSYALSGREKELYRDMKMAIESKTPHNYEYSENSVSINILHAASMLYTGNYDGYSQYRKQSEVYAPVYDYLDMLFDLFASDMISFNERLVYFITSSKSMSLRLYAYKLMLMSKYIDDGTFFRHYVTGNTDAMKPILKIAGKDTPLMYEFSQMTGFEFSASEMECDSNDMLYMIMTDYENNTVNREQLSAFIKKYPAHPLTPLLRGLQ